MEPKGRLILASVLAGILFIVVAYFKAPFLVAIGFAAGLFLFVYFTSDPEYIAEGKRLRAEKRARQEHLKLIREESMHSELGRQEARSDFERLEERRERLRRDPTGGAFGPSIMHKDFVKSFGGHKKRR